MRFELKVNGDPVDRFATADEAEARARDLVRENADVVVEVIDLTTGRPSGAAAGAAERDEMARKIGY